MTLIQDPTVDEHDDKTKSVKTDRQILEEGLAKVTSNGYRGDVLIAWQEEVRAHLANTEPSPLAQAITLVQNAGYVTLRAKSYRQAQERQRVAEALRQYADERMQGAEAWARDSLHEERRLRERLTFVWGIAKAHGATDEELRGAVANDSEMPE